MVEECVKESVRALMLESGLLSSIISEVMKGINVPSLLENRQPVRAQQQEPINEVTRLGKVAQMSSLEKQKLNATKQRLLDGVGKGAYGGVNLFEGIKDTIPDETDSNAANPLGGIAPNDPGVDISGLFDMNRMQAHLKGKK